VKRRRPRRQIEAGPPSPKGRVGKSSPSPSIRQAVCYWLLYLVMVLLVLCVPDAPNILGERPLSQADPLTMSEALLTPMIRCGDAVGPLFPWRLRRSRQRHTIRLPKWVSRILGLWALLRQMRSWNMAHWIAFLSRYQMARFVGGMLFLYPILEELGVAEVVNSYCPTEAEVEHGTVTSVLVLNRLSAPRPLYKVARWMAFTILPLVLGISARKFNDDRLGRTLDAIEPHLQAIWLEIVIRALERYNIDLSVIFYDLTAFIMMGEYKGSELVDFGFAHNTPMNKRKVKLAGNAVQDGGLLFAWAALSGQEADMATVEENVERLQQVLHRHEWPEEGVLLVGDRAMLNSRLAILYDGQKKNRLYYLGGLEPRAKEHKELLAEMSLLELRANYLLGERGHRYWGLKRPITFTYENEQTGEKKKVTHTALVVFSEATHLSWRSKYIGQLRELSQQLQAEVKDRLNEPYWRNPKTIRQRAQSRLDKSPVGEAMKVEVWGERGKVKMRWWVDRQALRKMCRLKGRYLLVTDHPRLSAVEMLETYKDKDKVEKRFRVAKGVLRVRPIYLHKDERIAAMLLVNMIALLVYSLLERRCRRNGLQITGRQMLYEFGPLHVIETHCEDGSVLYRSMPLTPAQRVVLQRVGLEGKTLLDSLRWTTDEASGRQLILPPPRGQLLLDRVEQAA
jgi:transposase